MNEGHVFRWFKEIAYVVNVKIVRDREKGTPVGFGFVTFQDCETAKRVFQMNG